MKTREELNQPIPVTKILGYSQIHISRTTSGYSSTQPDVVDSPCKIVEPDKHPVAMTTGRVIQYLSTLNGVVFLP